MMKADLRKEYIEKRKKINPELACQYSSLISDAFLANFPEASTKTIHCYLPIAAMKEVDTTILINKIFSLWPASTVIVPKSNMQTCEMENYIFKKDSQVSFNSWGIPEPEAGELCTPNIVDYVITPLLAYDVRGNRVGYGKGFYDRFFSQCKKDVVKIGLSCFEPVSIIKDLDAHDASLDYCITPEKIFKF